jgi:hypothetical protein
VCCARASDSERGMEMNRQNRKVRAPSRPPREGEIWGSPTSGTYDPAKVIFFCISALKSRIEVWVWVLLEFLLACTCTMLAGTPSVLKCLSLSLPEKQL